MELIIAAAGLGVSATFLVPFLYGIVKGFLPATITSSVSIPTTYPSTGSGFLWSTLTWGVLLGAALWAISFIRPVGTALREEV